MAEQQKYGHSAKDYDPKKYNQRLELYANDIDAYESELARTQEVIQNRQQSGMDISAQLNHLKKLQEVGANHEDALKRRSIERMLQERGQSLYEQQESSINQSFQNQITAIEKAYSDAVAQGKMSEEEAQAQFQANVEAINKLAYRDSQVTNLTANSRGIQNSQQLLGLMAGDNARKNNNITDARTARDARINEIKTRINNLKTQRDLDVANLKAQRDNALIGARAGVDSQILNQLAEFNIGNYQADLQQRYAMEQMSKQQEYALEQMSQQQQYALEQIGVNFQNDLTKMKTQHGYDLEKMDVAFNQDLQKMAQQFGYDMKKIGAQHANQIAQINARKNAAIQQAQSQYEIERQRLYDSHYDPTSQEYKIREAQINEAEKQAITQLHQQALYSSLNEVMKQGSFGYSDWLNNPSRVVGNADVYLNNNTPGNHKKTMTEIGRKSVPNLGR